MGWLAQRCEVEVPETSPDVAASEILGTTPETPATEPETTSAQAAEDADVTEVSETSEEPTSAAPTGISPKVQRIVDTKYGGDWDKFADSIYEQQNSAARLHEEIKGLRELISAEKQAAEKTAEATPHPDIKWLEEQVQALDAEKATVEQRRQQILLDINKRDREIAMIEGEMRRADDLDKQTLLQQKLRAETALERLMERFEGLGDRQRQIDYRKREFQYQRKFVDSRVDAERAQQQRADLEVKARESEWQNEFLSAFEEEAGKFTMSDDDRDYMFDVIVGQVGAYLSSLPKNSPPIDLAEYVRKGAARHATAMKLSAKTAFVDQTRAKLATRTQIAPKGANVAPAQQPAATPGSTKTAQPLSAADARARAARILGG